MDGKTKAIIAHITLIGWIIALVMNNQEKDEYASYYIRQSLGIMLIALLLTWVPYIWGVASIAALVLWILSLINAASGEMKPIPVVGEYFQDWFKGI